MKKHDLKAREPNIAPARDRLVLYLQRLEHYGPKQKALHAI